MNTRPVAQCRHSWIANGGTGGKPDFRLNSMLCREPIMYVKCGICGQRTWFTSMQWNALTGHIA